MVKTAIINKSGSTLLVKEGSGGIFRSVFNIPEGERRNLSVDTNATYRQFLLIIKPDFLHILSNDDCAEFDSVTVNVVDGKFKVESTPRALKSNSGAPPPPAPPPPRESFGKRVRRSIASYFRDYF
ncbi:hypothetical protein KC19_3G022800 [Ceratodon purpureus]|uniref:DUF7748 domain-containing protein n=1 Tax=Ceratodon purpureus TaxID=3225 RepID=A0A8T0IHL8_CERPU|nr:hypothetical protein KC19_3G022800 [Ceratodon purpureus]